MARNTSFEWVWTKTSVSRILERYISLPDSTYLCDVFEFRYLWEKYKQELRELGESFDSYNVTPKDSVCFFRGQFSLGYGGARKVRIDFLKHEIKRLTKK
jgi:hypothetical protein